MAGLVDPDDLVEHNVLVGGKSNDEGDVGDVVGRKGAIEDDAEVDAGGAGRGGDDGGAADAPRRILGRRLQQRREELRVETLVAGHLAAEGARLVSDAGRGRLVRQQGDVHLLVAQELAVGARHAPPHATQFSRRVAVRVLRQQLLLQDVALEVKEVDGLGTRHVRRVHHRVVEVLLLEGEPGGCHRASVQLAQRCAPCQNCSKT